MSKVTRTGLPVGSGFSVTGSGKLLGFLISHAETTTQTVTFYDDTSAPSVGNELLTVHIAPEQCPTLIRFPRDLPIQFSTGLAISYGNCDLNVWVVGYSG